MTKSNLAALYMCPTCENSSPQYCCYHDHKSGCIPKMDQYSRFLYKNNVFGCITCSNTGKRTVSKIKTGFDEEMGYDDNIDVSREHF